MSSEQKRLAIGEVLDGAFARPGRGKPEEKLLVFRRGRAPADLAPYGSQRKIETKPLDPRAERGALRLRAPERRPWSPLRLSRELAPYLDGRACWPTYAEFQAAGLDCLWRQVQLNGGSRRWAAEFGVDLARWRNPLKSWTEERVRDELRRFLAWSPKLAQR